MKHTETASRRMPQDAAGDIGPLSSPAVISRQPGLVMTLEIGTPPKLKTMLVNHGESP